MWYEGRRSSLGKNAANFIVCQNDFVDGIFLAFEIGRKGEVVGVRREEDFWQRSVMAEGVLRLEL